METGEEIIGQAAAAEFAGVTERTVRRWEQIGLHFEVDPITSKRKYKPSVLLAFKEWMNLIKHRKIQVQLTIDLPTMSIEASEVWPVKP